MKKYALIIGNDQYDDGRFKPLCAPIADVEQLTTVLADPQIGNFDVQPIMNQGENAISRLIERFFRDRHKDDLLLIHFSGHGIRDVNGKLFLAVKDTDPDAPSSSGIPARFVTEQMDQCRSQRIFLMLDCCHAGAFAEGTRGVGTSVGSQQAFEGNGYGRWVLTASDETQYAFEGPQESDRLRPSVFTGAIVEGLRTGKADRHGIGVVSVRDLADYAYEQVRGAGYQQTPCLWTYKERGELLVADNPAPQLPPHLVSETRSRLVKVRCDAVSELSVLLRTTKSKKIADQARVEILRLIDDDSKRVSNAANEALAEFVDAAPIDHVLALDQNLPELVKQFRNRQAVSSAEADNETLEMLLEAAHCLKSGSLDDALRIMLEASLRLTGADRGFIFFQDSDRQLRLAAGLNARGDILEDSSTVPLPALGDCLNGTSEFLFLKGAGGDSTKDLNNLVCLPIYKRRAKIGDDDQAVLWGVFYLDGRVRKCDFSTLSPDLLRTIAKGAEAVIGEAAAIEIEETARRYRQELSIASEIQSRLIPALEPAVSFAHLHGKSLPCREIGGDFFDFVSSEDSLACVLADISGKGVAAALLASVLQGICFTQLTSGVPLSELVANINRFFFQKTPATRYATMFIARIWKDGALEYVNCGHLPPMLVSGGTLTRLDQGNVPVGLWGDVKFESVRVLLRPGDRCFLFTDGLTEAENTTGEMFGEHRLETVLASGEGIEAVLSALEDFSSHAALTDDCTLVELAYSGS
jgi:phosphoserine phosphatase RsbU/P